CAGAVARAARARHARNGRTLQERDRQHPWRKGETMKEDDYARLEALCAGFQRQWIADLRDTLRAHGIADEVAKSVCGDFSFALSMLLDQGEIAYQGRMCRPFVAFEAESGDEEPGEMIVEPLGPEFHEYAYGTTEEAWEDT